MATDNQDYVDAFLANQKDKKKKNVFAPDNSAQVAQDAVNADFQEDPNAPYQEDPAVIDQMNQLLHTSGNLQRQTSRQMFNKDMAKQDAERKKKDLAEALAKKQGSK